MFWEQTASTIKENYSVFITSNRIVTATNASISVINILSA